MNTMWTKAAVLACFVMAGAVGAEAATLPQKAIISGTVVSVTPSGTAVKEGDVLVTVNSLAGPVPAARAEADGTVGDVVVEKGQNITKQAVVAFLNTK